jgi:hypothetical protein
MNTYQPYTYLVGWSDIDKWYYGVRFAKNCHPSDLWTTYFTSSKYVALLREAHGEPDVIQVRKTFTDSNSARSWELKVLQRMKVIQSDTWLNRAAGKAICPIVAAAASTRRMLSNNPMKDPVIAAKVAKKVSVSNTIRYAAMSVEEKSIKFGNPGATNPFFGKQHPVELQQQITRKISGNYTITSPNGDVNNINNLYRYCKENNLNRDILMKHMGMGVIPAPVYKTSSVSRHNTTGYTISCID